MICLFTLKWMFSPKTHWQQLGPIRSWVDFVKLHILCKPSAVIDTERRMSLGQAVITYFLLPGLLVPVTSFLLYKVLSVPLGWILIPGLVLFYLWATQYRIPPVISPERAERLHEGHSSVNQWAASVSGSAYDQTKLGSLMLSWSGTMSLLLEEE